jgi:hypothetical protein
VRKVVILISTAIIITCLAIVSTGLGASRVWPTQAGTSPCGAQIPDEFTGAVQGGLTRKMSEGPVLAARDNSMTLLVFCAGLTSRSPELHDGNDVLDQIGGLLFQGPTGPANFVVYPPTRGSAVSVVLGGNVIAEITFPKLIPQRCTLPATSPVTWRACQSIGLIDWQTSLEIPASQVALVEGSVMDTDGSDLGFYADGWHDQGGLLDITLGFRKPSGTTISVAISRITLRNGTVIVGPSIEVPISGWPD